jgi:hypothetical protein
MLKSAISSSRSLNDKNEKIIIIEILTIDLALDY